MELKSIDSEHPKKMTFDSPPLLCDVVNRMAVSLSPNFVDLRAAKPGAKPTWELAASNVAWIPWYLLVGSSPLPPLPLPSSNQSPKGATKGNKKPCRNQKVISLCENACKTHQICLNCKIMNLELLSNFKNHFSQKLPKAKDVARLLQRDAAKCTYSGTWALVLVVVSPSPKEKNARQKMCFSKKRKWSFYIYLLSQHKSRQQTRGSNSWYPWFQGNDLNETNENVNLVLFPWRRSKDYCCIVQTGGFMYCATKGVDEVDFVAMTKT